MGDRQDPIGPNDIRNKKALPVLRHAILARERQAEEPLRRTVL
jgi:hypothetical protein